MSDDLISAERIKYEKLCARLAVQKASEHEAVSAIHQLCDDNERLAVICGKRAAEITRLRAQVEAGDKLAEAVAGLVSILDQNETKGPISDVQLMFCWLAAQDVRAAAKGAKAK